MRVAVEMLTQAIRWISFGGKSASVCLNAFLAFISNDLFCAVDSFGEDIGGLFMARRMLAAW